MLVVYNSAKCQVVDLISSKICKKYIKYPSVGKYSLFKSGGLLNGVPVVCGGEADWDPLSECYMYDRNARWPNLWKPHAKMGTDRFFHATVTMKDKLWITGGTGIRSTEFVFPNKSAVPGPDLPFERSRHCIADLLDGRYMIIAGGHDERMKQRVDIYDSNQRLFTRGPNLLFKRVRCACTVIKSPLHADRPVVIVAGGYLEGSVEVLDYTRTGAVWEECKCLF